MCDCKTANYLPNEDKDLPNFGCTSCKPQLQKEIDDLVIAQFAEQCDRELAFTQLTSSK
tara:strand:- start:22129 stop:22305 length:177 start_codon:yes stop_codon:yes gene_type:complete